MKTLIVLFSLFALNANAAVLAKIGSKEITDDQIRAEYDMMSNEQRKAVNSDPNTRRGIVENAINSELMIDAAIKAGMDNDAEYKKALERFRKQYLASKMMEKAIEPKLTKSEIKKFFEDNKGVFDTSQVCASHIVVSDESTANKVMNELKAKGSKFEVLAKKYSLDPSVAENKGNLGCFTRERMVPEFAAAAFSMRKSELKGPIKTMYGYHVIKVNEIKAGKVPGFDEVEQKAKDAFRYKLLQDLINDLRAKNNVKIDDNALNSFKL